MLQRLLRAFWRSRDASGSDTPEDFYVYRVNCPEGFRDIVSLVRPGTSFEGGLAGNAVLGTCRRLLTKGDKVTPENFVPNEAFVCLLHAVIAAHGREIRELQRAARQQAEGWVYLIDARTPDPTGDVPPRDIIGAFEVTGGTIVPASYKRNPAHMLISQDGIFRLQDELYDRVLQAVGQRTVDGSHPTA